MAYLFENSLGYYIFTKDTDKLELINTYKFKTVDETLDSYEKIAKDVVPQNLLDFVKKAGETTSKLINVSDPRLKSCLSKSFDGDVVYIKDRVFNEIRSYISQIEDQENLRSSTLHLAHKLACGSVNINVDKIDTMITQSIILLSDLDKDINMHCMRLREWYGFHFPELGDIIEDNLKYILAVVAIGKRDTWKDSEKMKTLIDDLTELVGAHVEKISSLIGNSMGTEMSDEDIDNIIDDCKNIVKSFRYRNELLEYIKAKMNILAPNLTSLVGEVMGARLINKCGSIENLAKLPSSTVQLLGAEKSLFQALRKKGNTPKYGIIYESGVLGPVSLQYKGKVARTLASKISLCAKIDALGDNKSNEFGKKCKTAIDKRIKSLEDRMKAKKKKTTKSKFVISNEEVVDYSKDAKRIKRD